jgi:hypothetical protein
MKASVAALAVAIIVVATGGVANGWDKPPAQREGRYALLVGVTKYPNLPERYALDGPGNDVVVLRKLLEERFRFPADNIVTLAEASGNDERRPTWRNIKREIDTLAQKVKSGDQVVLLLSGHGTQVPHKGTLSPNDPVPEGMDNVFLPADIGRWAAGDETIPHAIRDVDLHEWLKPFQEKDAHVWVIADCCHSGTILRATDQEKARKVKPEDLGIPKERIEAVREQARKVLGVRGAVKSPKAWRHLESDKLVGLYACLATEETVEKLLPEDSRDAKTYGLLTFTLCQLLAQHRSGRPLTYRELLDRIDDQYKRWGRTYPTPLLEGKQQHREVLGTTIWRVPPFRLTTGKDAWTLDGGRLHGLTECSILAVYSPEGETDKPLGYVRIKRIRTFEADAEPCEHAGMPALKELPDIARCDPVTVDYGDLRLKLAVAQVTTRGKPVPGEEQERMARQLQKLTRAKGSVSTFVEDPAKADWLVVVEGGQAYLLPTQGAQKAEDGRLSPGFGPYVGNQGMVELKDAVEKIARARNLLLLANSPESDRAGTPARVKVEIEVLKYQNESDKQGESVGANAVLHAGDIIAFRVHNRSRGKIVYPTILFVDSAYGITGIYPDLGEVVEPLKPGASFTTEMRRLKDKTLGLEQVVVIAVRARGAPVDFSRLEQPSIEKAKGAKLRGDEDGLDTPLGQMLQSAFYGATKHRGLERVDIDEFSIGRASWNTVRSRK